MARSWCSKDRILNYGIYSALRLLIRKTMTRKRMSEKQGKNSSISSRKKKQNSWKSKILKSSRGNRTNNFARILKTIRRNRHRRLNCCQQLLRNNNYSCRMKKAQIQLILKGMETGARLWWLWRTIIARRNRLENSRNSAKRRLSSRSLICCSRLMHVRG